MEKGIKSKHTIWCMCVCMERKKYHNFISSNHNCHQVYQVCAIRLSLVEAFAVDFRFSYSFFYFLLWAGARANTLVIERHNVVMRRKAKKKHIKKSGVRCEIDTSLMRPDKLLCDRYEVCERPNSLWVNRLRKKNCNNFHLKLRMILIVFDLRNNRRVYLCVCRGISKTNWTPTWQW